MTLVVAAQFGARIVVFSDTMISGDHLVRNDIIPGQLKSIILDGKLSVSYAGAVSTGLRVIREAKDLFSKNRNLSQVTEFIRSEALAVLSTPYECDFLIVSHVHGPNITKISSGSISTGGTRYWIGNSEPIQKLGELEEAIPQPTSIPPHSSEKEFRFRQAMMNLLLEPAVHAESKVGGFVIELLASPFGHCYGLFAFQKFWDVIELPQGVTPAQLENRAAGMTLFGCHIMGSFYRGVAVVGAFLEQAKLGYIYRPLEEDCPQKLYPCTAEEISRRVTSFAIEMGGFLDEE